MRNGKPRGFVVRTGFEPVKSFIWFRVGTIPISCQNIERLPFRHLTIFDTALD